MRLVTIKAGGLHILSDDSKKTYCGFAGVNVEDMLYSSVRPSTPNGHSYGDELMKSATCSACKEKARRKLNTLNWFSVNQRNELYRATFGMFRAPRPLPQRKNMGGVNTIMSNVRERLRRKSETAARQQRLWTVKNSWEDATISTWDNKEHAAYMLGVNYAIHEVFDAFKLEQYDKFKAQAYADLHEIITGDTLPDDRNRD